MSENDQAHSFIVVFVSRAIFKVFYLRRLVKPVTVKMGKTRDGVVTLTMKNSDKVRAVASMRHDEQLPRLDFALFLKKRLIDKIIPGKIGLVMIKLADTRWMN